MASQFVGLAAHGYGRSCPGIAVRGRTKDAGNAWGGMALRIKHVGQYGAHAAGKNAGFQTDDVLVSYDGRTDLMTDSDVLRYGVTARQSGDVVAVEILRGSERKTLKLPMQE